MVKYKQIKSSLKDESVKNNLKDFYKARDAIYNSIKK